MEPSVGVGEESTETLQAPVLQRSDGGERFGEVVRDLRKRELAEDAKRKNICLISG